MRLKSKVIINISLIALLGLMVLAVTLSTIAVNISSDAISEQVEQRLVGLRDAKKAQIENYFSFIESQAVSFSSNLTVIQAAEEFTEAYNHYLDDASLPDEGARNTSLKSYYSSQFLAKYRDENGGSDLTSERLMAD